MTVQQALTVVVVENKGQTSEPYLGRPPENGDRCLVFGQHADESPFLLDLRVRECLDQLRATEQQLDNAVLFWAQGSSDRDVLRRSKLLARKLRRGSRIVYSTYEPAPLALQMRLRRLAKIAHGQLAPYGVEVLVRLEGTPSRAESTPPMTAAWQRIQRYRAQRAKIQTGEQPLAPACVTATFVDASESHPAAGL